MLARFPTGRHSPAPSASTNKPFLLLTLLAVCAALLLLIEAFVLRLEKESFGKALLGSVVLVPEESELREDSYPGLVFSTDRLRYGTNGDSYWFCLSRRPNANVTVRIEDPSKCTTTTRSLHIVFTPEDWHKPRRVKASFSSAQGLCPQGLVHACDSDDSDYDGFHARLWIDSPPELQRSDEKTGEWVPEEELEAEEEGPQMALANLERSRSAFNFPKSEFRCRPVANERDKLQCVIGYGTSYETPFYVVDPKYGVDEDGWNGFPVVLIVGGSHGTEAAGVGGAIHIAQHFRPRRGRLIILPYANIRGLKTGTRYIPQAEHKSDSDLNRNFPLDEDPQGDLAHAMWNLIYKIRPDILFDLHEGWGYYAKTKNRAHKVLVNSKKFSKGSSVICTEDANLLARAMLSKVNDDKLPAEKRFEMISPPIAGGLAMKMNREFHTRSLVLETTKLEQSLQLRVSQHLRMVTAGLIAANVLPPDYDESGFYNTRCILIVPYGKEFSQGTCYEEKDGVIHFASSSVSSSPHGSTSSSSQDSSSSSSIIQPPPPPPPPPSPPLSSSTTPS